MTLRSSKKIYAQVPVRMALWGCGGVAEAHLKAAQKFNIDIEVAALVDTNPKRFQIIKNLDLARNSGTYNCISPILNDPSIDTVAIFLLHYLH